MFRSESRTSAKTGVAPAWTITFAVAGQVMGVVITSSPGPTPTASSARCSAAVPDATASTWSAWTYSAKRRSSSAARGPVVNQPERRVSATASISSSPIAGGWNPSIVARLEETLSMRGRVTTPPYRKFHGPQRTPYSTGLRSHRARARCHVPGPDLPIPACLRRRGTLGPKRRPQIPPGGSGRPPSTGALDSCDLVRLLRAVSGSQAARLRRAVYLRSDPARPALDRRPGPSGSRPSPRRQDGGSRKRVDFRSCLGSEREEHRGLDQLREQRTRRRDLAHQLRRNRSPSGHSHA